MRRTSRVTNAAVMALAVSAVAHGTANADLTPVAVAPLPSGGALVALNEGVDSLSAGTAGEVRRLRPNGTWDRGFGRGGALDVGGPVQFDGVLVRPSGTARIVAHRNRRVVVWKLRANGRVARGFGREGRRRVPGLSYAVASAMSPSGRIAIAGWLPEPTASLDDFGVTRLTARGRLDRRFGSGGTRAVPDGASMEALQFLPNGGLRGIAGPTDDEVAGDDPPYWVDRISGTGGFTHLVGRQSLGLGSLGTLDVDAQGRLIVTGQDAELRLMRRVKRLTPGGDPDVAFGSGGDAVVTVGHRHVLLPDGGLLWYRAVDGANEIADGRLTLERWAQDGSVTARATTPPLLFDADKRFVDHAAALLSDGSLVLAGGSRAAGDPDGPETPVILIARPDGTAVSAIAVPVR